MIHQVREYHVSVSEQLSTILDNVGYSWDDRNRKVKVATEVEVFGNISAAIRGKPRLYLFGSRGEGSTGPELDSDVDHLYQINECKVITDLSQYQPHIHNVLMVKDKHTHPGYVKLKHTMPTFISIDTPVPNYPELHFEDVVAIDSLHGFVLPNTVINKYGIVTGPALHFSAERKEFAMDQVFALRCSEWPKDEYEWFRRRRLYGWPTPLQIADAREYGCFVTPVGHVLSLERYLEWRLSFSITERDLTRSFEDTVMKVYILLKMIRKTYIAPVVGDAFSSYHCKVCLLWMRESTPRELWNDQNLLYCLILCIRQLYEWAKSGFCPDYFIVSNNIYDRKIVGTVRFNLVHILRNLSVDGTFLLGIQCCNLGQHMTNQMSRLDNLIKSIVREDHVDDTLSIKAACDCRHYILKCIPQQYSALIDYLKRINNACKYLSSIVQYPLKHTMMVLWSQLGFHIATICIEKQRDLSQEHVDYLVALATACLSFGINIDSTSIRLKLCGLGMELGNHDLTQACLQNISNYRARYISSVHLRRPINVLNDVDLFSVEKYHRNIFSTEELLQTQTSVSVVYMPSEISFTPKPLRMEMFRSIGALSKFRDMDETYFDWGVVDSRTCLYFFQYMNFSRQAKETHKWVAMNNMIHVIKTGTEIIHRDTALNLLGYSFMQERQLTNAFRCFILSLEFRHHHNAAKFHLGILFNKVHAAK
ncbi:hypothetical protein CHS0354_021965 [Potamilus streckersoni]|uniref:Mab-21-like HhH/H2TH-like domain-containing protein n=1 Tax=Potamilus streckersoni TaxID=2493646 RepID=A0AAE0SJY2_9BIVA|nr:hypothetical protein CHS0354_021965 [Potamilus streckersoni]